MKISQNSTSEVTVNVHDVSLERLGEDKSFDLYFAGDRPTTPEWFSYKTTTPEGKQGVLNFYTSNNLQHASNLEVYMGNYILDNYDEIKNFDPCKSSDLTIKLSPKETV